MLWGGGHIASHHTDLKQCCTFGGGQVPYPRRPVHAASGQLPPIGTEGDAVDDVGVALSEEKKQGEACSSKYTEPHYTIPPSYLWPIA